MGTGPLGAASRRDLIHSRGCCEVYIRLEGKRNITELPGVAGPAPMRPPVITANDAWGWGLPGESPA